MSPYLDQPIRSRQEAARDMIAKLLEGDTYIIIDTISGTPYGREFDLGQSRGAVVFDLATGQYDCPVRDKTGRALASHTAPIAVLCFGRGEPAEDVTESIARDVLAYRIRHDLTHDDEGRLKECPFLDWAMPDWEDQVRAGRVDAPEREKDVA